MSGGSGGTFSKKKKEECKFGVNCKKRDTCTFRHPGEEVGENMIDEFANMNQQ